MGLEKRTVKIIVVVIIALLIIGGIIGLIVGRLNQQVSDQLNPNVQLEVWPKADDYYTNRDQPLIQFQSRNPSSFLPWVQRIDDFLREYRKKGSGTGAENLVPCDPTIGPLGEKQVCDVPVDDFHPCTPSNQYNYERGEPCVFLRLNKILNWVPKPYNNTEDLPERMPVGLKQHIRQVAGKPEANIVWVSCEGETPADMEYIGPVEYIPRRGFPAYYYPFTNKEGYLSPLVAVLFERPTTGVLINIECKAWAKNIFLGSVHFQLMVD